MTPQEQYIEKAKELIEKYKSLKDYTEQPPEKQYGMTRSFLKDEIKRVESQLSDLEKKLVPEMHDRYIDFLAYLYENEINIRNEKTNWQELVDKYLSPPKYKEMINDELAALEKKLVPEDKQCENCDKPIPCNLECEEMTDAEIDDHFSLKQGNLTVYNDALLNRRIGAKFYRDRNK